MNARRSPVVAASIAVLLGVAATASALSLGTGAAVAQDGDGIGLSVEVTGTPAATPTPSPSSSSPAAGGSGSGSGSSGGSGSKSGSGSSTPDSVVVGTSSTPKPTAGEVDLGGILFISGLSSDYEWSVDPFAGSSDTRFTVRNVSNSTIDSSVRFWADGPFGNQLSEVKNVKITALKPHESREIHATLTGLGQWTFIESHATFTPPKKVDGVKLASITRDQFLFVPPWLILGLAALAFGASAIRRGVRSAGEADATPAPVVATS